MKKIKPKFIYDNKNKQRGVLLSVKDFEILIEELQDYADYQMVKDIGPIDLKECI